MAPLVVKVEFLGQLLREMLLRDRKSLLQHARRATQREVLQAA
jgi:hypothetical protein